MWVNLYWCNKKTEMNDVFPSLTECNKRRLTAWKSWLEIAMGWFVACCIAQNVKTRLRYVQKCRHVDHGFAENTIVWVDFLQHFKNVNNLSISSDFSIYYTSLFSVLNASLSHFPHLCAWKYCNRSKRICSKQHLFFCK